MIMNHNRDKKEQQDKNWKSVAFYTYVNIRWKQDDTPDVNVSCMSYKVLQQIVDILLSIQFSLTQCIGKIY